MSTYTRLTRWATQDVSQQWNNKGSMITLVSCISYAYLVHKASLTSCMYNVYFTRAPNIWPNICKMLYAFLGAKRTLSFKPYIQCSMCYCCLHSAGNSSAEFGLRGFFPRLLGGGSSSSLSSVEHFSSSSSCQIKYYFNTWISCVLLLTHKISIRL